MSDGIHDSCWLSPWRSPVKASKQNTAFCGAGRQAFCRVRNAAPTTRTEAKNGRPTQQSGLPHFLLFCGPQRGPDPPRESGCTRNTVFLSLFVKLFLFHENIPVLSWLKLLLGMERKQEVKTRPSVSKTWVFPE